LLAIDDRNGEEKVVGIWDTMLSIRTFLLTALLVVMLCQAGHADIYVKQMPDGSLSFSNCPMGKGWDMYMKEKRRPKFHPQLRATNHKRSDWDNLITNIAINHGVDPVLVKGIIEVESGFEPSALSSKGAMGLMQLMPETANDMGVDDPWDPVQNIKGGTKYLSLLLKKYNGDLEKALAAYNAGPQAVDSYKGIPPYQETQDYVRTVIAKYTGRGY
jgi:hypothetical protein